MKKIYKYPLAIDDVQEIRVPSGCIFRSVGCQHGELVMWVEVDDAARLCTYIVFVVGTGNPLPSEEMGDYVGTALMHNGLVWHVYVR